MGDHDRCRCRGCGRHPHRLQRRFLVEPTVADGAYEAELLRRRAAARHRLGPAAPTQLGHEPAGGRR